LCSVRQALKVLATQITVCVVIEVFLELIKTDFERAQLKYYNFLRANDAMQYDDDAHIVVIILSIITLDTGN